MSNIVEIFFVIKTNILEISQMFKPKRYKESGSKVFHEVQFEQEKYSNI